MKNQGSLAVRASVACHEDSPTAIDEEDRTPFMIFGGDRIGPRESASLAQQIEVLP